MYRRIGTFTSVKRSEHFFHHSLCCILCRAFATGGPSTFIYPLIFIPTLFSHSPLISFSAATLLYADSILSIAAVHSSSHLLLIASLLYPPQRRATFLFNLTSFQSYTRYLVTLIAQGEHVCAPSRNASCHPAASVYLQKRHLVISLESGTAPASPLLNVCCVKPTG